MSTVLKTRKQTSMIARRLRPSVGARLPVQVDISVITHLGRTDAGRRGLPLLGYVLAALLLTAASLATTADFQASRPGADLSPVGNADQVIQILQGNKTVLWTSLSSPVASYRVEGWPVAIDDNELGGALMIERPEDGTAGVIDFAEKPKSLGFEIDG
jgi:hypothetical protein